MYQYTAHVSGWPGQRSARGQPSQGGLRGRCKTGGRGRIIRIEKFSHSGWAAAHQLGFDAPRLALLCSASRLLSAAHGVDVTPALIRRLGHTTFRGFPGTQGAQQGVPCAAAQPAWCSISKPEAATMFLALVAKEACGMHVRIHLCGGGSGGGLRIGKARTGRVTRLTRSSVLGESNRGHSKLQGWHSSANRWPRDRAHQAGPGQRSPLPRRREARRGDVVTSGDRCLQPRERLVSLTISRHLSPPQAGSRLHEDICSVAGATATSSTAAGTDRIEQGKGQGLIKARLIEIGL